MAAKRDFLTLRDLSLDEARSVLALAAKLKAAPKGYTDLLRGYVVCCIMEKPSLRTRGSFEAGVAQLGGHPFTMFKDELGLGVREPIRDAARVLERYCDAIVYRTFEHSRVVEMATAKIPVINALTDDSHPAQILADIFTVEEVFGGAGSITGKRVAYVSNGASNTARSWMEAAPMFGFHLTIASPEDFRPPAAEVAAAGDAVSFRSALPAVRDADVIYTDVWTSMGQEERASENRAVFADYTVDAQLLSVAPPRAILLHCLPAHRGEEITDEAIESAQSRVWDQAENRLHVQKALLCFLLGVADKIA